MKRLCLALAVGVLLLMTMGVGTAAADDSPALQDVGQLAGSAQDAGAVAGTAQQQPTNDSTAAPPPAESGSVNQSNTATSNGTAFNLNATKQDANQEQDGSGVQAIGQSAENDQDALALAFTLQQGAANTNTPVRVFSTGDSGDVTQSNDASSDATAANINATKQDADQDQSGGDCKCGGEGGVQAIGQSADSEQDATALAKTIQEKPSNKNISVRVLSPGDDGNVTQSNTASSAATAANINLTKQDADQEQDGGCKCGSGEQAIGQKANSEQDAKALAATVQEKPSNTNISVRVLSPGDDGDVTQSNTATSDATAANVNLTKQDADQDQDGSGYQAIGQKADSDQKALAASLTAQKHPTNKNISVRVLSPGDGGNVTQSNTATSDATAFNLNATKQDADQDQDGSCKCGSGEQAIGQFAENDQKAAALSATIQEKPSNTNTSVRVLSWGDDGDVTQSNDASSSATAANLNALKQDADQDQGGSGIQAIGQAAKSEQDAFALGLTFQSGASNENTPVRVLSPSKHGSGDVTQTNTASSDALAANVNLTKQDADQYQGVGGHDGYDCCGATGIQAIGQLAKNDQKAKAAAVTFQIFDQPCKCGDKGGSGNVNAPVSVLSDEGKGKSREKGDGGDVTQSNAASSDADALNINLLKQDADQDQEGSCRCSDSYGIQAIGQKAENDQWAAALAATFQIGASNTNAPVREGSDHMRHGSQPE